MSDKIRWGIIGPGAIAHEFAQDFQFVDGGDLVAVASRSMDRAKEFADQYKIEHAFGSYGDLIDSKEVDALYIATPHNHHFQNSRDALERGKAVLCEKPVTVNQQECESLMAIAHASGTYLMEGMWTYFLPAIKKAKQWIAEGRIGEIIHFKSDFGFRATFNPQGRLFNPDLAGGALLDIGIYPLAAAWYYLEKDPTNLSLKAKKAPTGVDDHLVMQMEYGDVTAELTASLRCHLPNWTYIVGDEGYIAIPNVWQTRECFHYENGKRVEHFNDKRRSNGYNFETDAVNADLLSGRKQSETVPLELSLKLQQHMELVRQKF